jgi:hypothetical protein
MSVDDEPRNGAQHAVHKAERAHSRIDDHEEALDHHDRRISKNENWRLQAQGALKVIIGVLGAGGLAVILDWAVNLF